MAQTPEEIIKSAYGTLEQASKITGTPVQYPTAPPVQPIQTQPTIAVDTAQAPTPPIFEPPPPPDDLSLKVQIEQQRKAMEVAYQAQLDQINKQMEEQRKIQEQEREKQVGILGQLEEQVTPFRADIERTERERLKIEENYFQNQALINELDRLLTESIEMTRKLQTQKVPGLAGLQQSERMIKSQQNVQGRIAVIEAVMAARNNQIGVAQGFIDRTIGAIQADRQDRISYLQTLSNFYEKTYDEAGNKIFNLTKDQKEMINKQIGLLEDDLARAEKTADKIKEIMLENPQMASEAGLSLSDTEDEIIKKMADVKYSREVIDQRNKQEEAGYSQISEEEAMTKPIGEVRTITDSKGKARYFWKEEADKVLSVTEAKALNVPYGTTKAQAMAMGITPAGKPEETTLPASDTAIRNWILENKRANPDIPYEDLWGQLADEMKKQGLNPSNYDKIFWEILHPEGEAGYQKYMKGTTTETIENPFKIKQ